MNEKQTLNSIPKTFVINEIFDGKMVASLFTSLRFFSNKKICFGLIATS